MVAVLLVFGAATADAGTHLDIRGRAVHKPPAPPPITTQTTRERTVQQHPALSKPPAPPTRIVREPKRRPLNRNRRPAE